MLVLLSVGAVVVFVLAVTGRLALDEPGDLVLPLAGAAVLSSLSGATSAVLSDWVGWAVPIGLATLVAVVLAATTSLSLSWRSPLALGAVVVGVAAAVVLHTTIEDAWHPTANGAVGAAWTDATLSLVSPGDGDTVAIGTVDVVVAVEGGTIGPGGRSFGENPEEFGTVRVFVDGRLVAGPDGQAVPQREDCDSGCVQATYPVELDRGPHVLSLEFLTADGESFATPQGQSPTVQIATVEAE